MKTAYDLIFEVLDGKGREGLAQVPTETIAEFNTADQALESNDAMRSAVVEFLVADITATPHRARQTIERVNRFLEATKSNAAGEKIVDDFKAKFKVKAADDNEEEPDSQIAKETAGKQSPQMIRDAKRITQQILFRSFFSMLAPEKRERLIEYIKERNLSDDELEKELRSRINDKEERDERKIAALFVQIKKGGMDCFLWLHQMLFEFFSSALVAEEKLDELKRKFDSERKLKTETPTGSPQVQTPTPEKRNEDTEIDLLKREMANLKAENRLLNDSKGMREELLAAKLETERAKFVSESERQISSLKTEKQALENSTARLADEFARRAKLSAHVFETFLDTLPPNYAAPGYGMLKSIVNEWDGDLQSVQEKGRKYTPSPKVEMSQNWRSNTSKVFMWISIIVVLILCASASTFAIHLWMQQRLVRPAQTAESHASADLSRLAKLKLETLEDINHAYDTLKPHATVDEILFLNARQQALMNPGKEEKPQ